MEEKRVGDMAAPVARDHARPCNGTTLVWSVGSRRSLSAKDESWRLTIRTERGVGLRPPTKGASLGPGMCIAEEDWKVEVGAGGGGLFGSQEG